jgi:hypothetical protein
MPKNKIALTPFEKAKINVQKTAENFNLYNSMVMLSEALESIDQLDDQDRRDMELMFASVIQQMATHLEGSGDEWN